MDAATLGNFISTQRKKLGMTQKELAEALEIHQSCNNYFSHINGGRLQQSASSSLTASPPKSLSL